MLWRAVVKAEERFPWALIGAGVLAWTVGEVYYTLALWNLSVIPIPSPADGGYLAFPLLAFVGICLLGRERARGAAPRLWADGLAAGLAVGAVSAAFVLDAVLRHSTGHRLAVITNLAYPVTDLVLLGSCATVIALRGWRIDRTWALIVAGVARSRSPTVSISSRRRLARIRSAGCSTPAGGWGSCSSPSRPGSRRPNRSPQRA